jgi:hypothetical protein
MNVSKKQLDEAVLHNIITQIEADRLYDFLHVQSEDQPNFSFTHVLYYMGGLIAIGAMKLFMNLAWESFGGLGIVIISMVYMLIGMLLTNHFALENLVIPAGICATFVVCITPLLIYGIQQWLGFWPSDNNYQEFHTTIKTHWLYMELGTLVVGILVAVKYKYPFLIMPIAFTLWYLSMDLTVILSGGDEDTALRSLVSLYSGLVMIGVAFWVDVKAHPKADYAFWLYLFGVIAFWGGFASIKSEGELDKLLFFFVNLILIFIGVILVRKVFTIFGAFGSCNYIGYLAMNIFQDSWLFPVSLTVLGLGVIYLGIMWHKHEIMITKKVRSFLPQSIRDLLQDKV